MKIGMLWFDNSGDDFATKCNRAIEYYKHKYNKPVTVIYCNPNENISELQDIEVIKHTKILPKHLWLGQKD